MKPIRKPGVILAATALAMMLPAAAEVKVTGTQSGATPPTLSSTFGKVVDAANIGGNSLKCDAISFSGLTVTGGVASQVIETSPFKVTLSTSKGNLASAPIGDDALFQTEAYSDGFQDISLVIDGLDPAKTYQVQYLHGETRNEVWARYDNGTQTFTDSKGSKVTAALTFNTVPGNNQFAVVTVEVTGSTSLRCDLPHSPAADGRGPSFAGFVVVEKQ